MIKGRFDTIIVEISSERDRERERQKDREREGERNSNNGGGIVREWDSHDKRTPQHYIRRYEMHVKSK